MFAGTRRRQNSIKVWCYNYRAHHQFADDNDHDPDKWLALLNAGYSQRVNAINEWSMIHQQRLELKKASMFKRWEETGLVARLWQLELDLNNHRRQWRMLTQQFV